MGGTGSGDPIPDQHFSWPIDNTPGAGVAAVDDGIFFCSSVFGYVSGDAWSVV